jgi:hypothetical protein
VTNARTLTVGATTYPVVLPSIRDPRLHVASVILTVHALGQLGLDFAVSIPQILAAIVTCAIIEITLTFRSSRAFVWPASAMLTGSGVALILRIGTAPNDHWATEGWWVYAGIAGLSLLSKYVIKYRGSHIFNPSNLGLVVAFVLLGSTRVEPLDFWWAPITNPAMLAAYVVIIGGGLLITRRLHLLALAATFWVALTIGTGVLAASGHCITTDWAFGPVCGVDFWRVIITSPEVLIFLFFMITDPKTVPAGRVARVAFGLLVAIVSTLLMAPQVNEYGTKVGLLAGLVVMCAARPVIERFLPAPKTAADTVRGFLERFATGSDEANAVGADGATADIAVAASADAAAGADHGVAGAAGSDGAAGADSAAAPVSASPDKSKARPGRSALRVAFRVGLAVVLVFVVGAGIVFAGTPARGTIQPDVTEILNRTPTHVDTATLPTITLNQEVSDYDLSLVGPGAQQLVVTLGENLEIESEALRRHDDSLLTAVDHGDRLDSMRTAMAQSTATGTTVTDSYRFDSIAMSVLQPFGKQSGLSLGLDSTGTVTEQTYDSSGNLVSTTQRPFAQMFVIRRATGGRWLNVAVLPPGSKG